MEQPEDQSGFWMGCGGKGKAPKREELKVGNKVIPKAMTLCWPYPAKETSPCLQIVVSQCYVWLASAAGRTWGISSSPAGVGVFPAQRGATPGCESPAQR